MSQVGRGIDMWRACTENTGTAACRAARATAVRERIRVRRAADIVLSRFAFGAEAAGKPRNVLSKQKF